MHHTVWFEDGGAGDHENYTISRLMGFSGENEVTTPLKVWQCLPAMSTRMTLTFRQVGENEWEMFTPQCVVPETGEAGGPEIMDYMVNKICGHLELFGFRHGAARWNPNIRIDPLKLPPRASADEPHCRWRITLEAEPVDYAAEPGAYVREHHLERRHGPSDREHRGWQISPSCDTHSIAMGDIGAVEFGLDHWRPHGDVKGWP